MEVVGILSLLALYKILDTSSKKTNVETVKTFDNQAL